jgi:hypothetical protein
MAALGGESVSVAVRIRPTPQFASSHIRLVGDQSDANSAPDRRRPASIALTMPKAQQQNNTTASNVAAVNAVNNQKEHFQFSFNALFSSSSQSLLYANFAADLVAAALDGVSGTLIAYGQTGSGNEERTLTRACSLRSCFAVLLRACAFQARRTLFTAT